MLPVKGYMSWVVTQNRCNKWRHHVSISFTLAALGLLFDADLAMSEIASCSSYVILSGRCGEQADTEAMESLLLLNW